MRRFSKIIIAALVLSGAAFSLVTPEPELLFKFFRNRLNIPGELVYESRNTVIANGETLTCVGIDSIICGEYHGADNGPNLSPFALSGDILMKPIDLSRVVFDSLDINKSRTRIRGIMCWKLKIFADDARWDIYLTGDGSFNVLKVERKRRGKYTSDDTWELMAIDREHDLPFRVTREAIFGWGDEQTTVISIRELLDPAGPEPSRSVR